MTVGPGPEKRMGKGPKDPMQKKADPLQGMEVPHGRMGPGPSQNGPGRKVPHGGTDPDPSQKGSGKMAPKGRTDPDPFPGTHGMGPLWGRTGPRPSKAGPGVSLRPPRETRTRFV